MNTTERRYDLDWLRVIAIILVLYFHTAMIFVEGDSWHIKNEQLSSLWEEFNFWLSRFRMPLLFFISGVGSYFALKKRTIWKYIKERNYRLTIPLIFSIFIIVPPQIYFERISSGVAYSSFFSFYPNTFSFETYPEGDFSWHHMWFVAYLFAYSVIAAPIFYFLKTIKGKQIITKLEEWLKGRMIYIISLPTILIYALWTVKFNRTNDLINDWGWFPYWMSFFVVGYVVACSSIFWKSIEQNRKISLKIAMLLTLIINIIRWNDIEPWTIGMKDGVIMHLYLSLLPAMGWMWLLTLLGYAKKYLNHSNPILAYANRGIYPFYILHQTIIVMVGYYVIQTQESMLSKYLFISTISLIGTVAVYDFLIKPFPIMRFLFGMKEEKKTVKSNFNIMENRAEYKAA